MGFINLRGMLKQFWCGRKEQIILDYILDNGRARYQLLCYNASSAEHCPAAMVELHGLVFFRLLWIIGRQAKWVEAIIKFLFAIIVGKCGSEFMPRSHNPECRPEILRCRLREVTCHRGHKWTLIPIVEDRVEFVRNKHTQG